jgi:hypothetical protein
VKSVSKFFFRLSCRVREEIASQHFKLKGCFYRQNLRWNFDGRYNRVGILTSLQAGRSGVRISAVVRKLPPKLPRRPWGPSSLQLNGERVDFPVKSGRGVKLTTHIHLVLSWHGEGQLKFLLWWTYFIFSQACSVRWHPRNFILKAHTSYTMDFKNILALMHNIVHTPVGSVCTKVRCQGFCLCFKSTEKLHCGF